jgi:hypothetical protein
MVSAYTMGGIIHLLLVIALIVVAIQFIQSISSPGSPGSAYGCFSIDTLPEDRVPGGV